MRCGRLVHFPPPSCPVPLRNECEGESGRRQRCIKSYFTHNALVNDISRAKKIRHWSGTAGAGGITEEEGGGGIMLNLLHRGRPGKGGKCMHPSFCVCECIASRLTSFVPSSSFAILLFLFISSFLPPLSISQYNDTALKNLLGRRFICRFSEKKFRAHCRFPLALLQAP